MFKYTKKMIEIIVENNIQSSVDKKVVPWPMIRNWFYQCVGSCKSFKQKIKKVWLLETTLEEHFVNEFGKFPLNSMLNFASNVAIW